MPDWEQQDRGWHTSALGGICKEADQKWYFYPAGTNEKIGPYATLGGAKAAADLRR